MPRSLRRLEIKLERANTSEIIGMVSIFGEAFLNENPKLAQAMYAGSHPTLGVEDILETQLHSEYSNFMIAYDTTKGLVPDPGFEREGVDDDMSYGWISLGVVPPDTTLNSYAACDLSVYASLALLATEARNRGDDPRQLSIDDPRVRLAHELATRSKEGQMNNVVKPYLVINSLAMWPGSHKDSIEEMASKLLGWAVEHAEGRPIWTQIPEGQMGFFLRAGFREVAAFTLNLNGYARPGGTDLGTQEWVQMVHRERRARSISPGDTGGRRRRLSF